MATRSELIAALRQADEAGDAEGAQRIAAMLKSTPAATAPAAAPAPAPKPAPKANPLGEAAEAVGVGVSRAANSATFGLADKASAALASGLSHLTGQPMSYSEADKSIQARRQAEGEEHPNAAVAGDVAGLFTGGLGLMKAVGAAAKLPGIGRPIAAVAERLAPVARQPVRNVLRHAGGGALAGTVQPTVNAATGEGSVAEIPVGAAVGAGVGGVAGPVVGAVAKAFRPLNDKVAAALARTMGETPSDVSAAWARFQQATGRNPSMAEIATLKARGEIKALAQESTAVGSAMNERAAAAGLERSQSVRAAAVDNSPAPSSGALRNARDVSADAEFDTVRAHNFALDDEALGYLQGTVIPATNLSRVARQTIARELEEGQLSGNSALLIRRSLGTQARSRPGEGFRELQEDVDDLIGSQPGGEAYGEAVGNYARRSARAEGVEQGEAVLKGSDTANFLADTAATARNPEAAAFIPTGVRGGLASAAETPGGAANLASRLASDAGLNERLSATLGREAAGRLQRLGQAEVAAAKNMSAVAPNAPASASAQEAEDINSAFHMVAATSPHGSPAWKVFHLGRLLTGLKMSEKVQERVAQYLSDPAMVQQGINLLRRAGVSNEELRRMALHGVNTAGIAGSQAVEPEAD